MLKLVPYVRLVSVVSPAGRLDDSDMTSKQVTVPPAEHLVLS